MVSSTLKSLAQALAPCLAELGLDPERIGRMEQGPGGAPGALEIPAPGAPCAGIVVRSGRASPEGARTLRERVLPKLADDGALLLWLEGQAAYSEELCRWREYLWPQLHSIALYKARGGEARRESQSGNGRLGGLGEAQGVLFAFRPAQHVLSPRATVEKFDHNAVSWNGKPGTPGYRHYRWMRRFVALYAPAPALANPRILDFGCGAGWVGIEAALRVPAATLCAFDPSPEMVRLTLENMRASGLQHFDACTGFGEHPPYPAAGELPFDLVISSGVLSFSPDLEAWLDGLASTCAKQATLIVGDLNPDSAGMQKRRRERPLLPIRELNARRASQIREGLERRGFRWHRSSGYQLTTPVPQAMVWSESHLGGAMHLPLLWANQGLASLDRKLGHRLSPRFDSWVMHLSAP